MPRVTEEESKRFHKILDDSIEKMNSPKNSEKIHWKNVYIRDIQKMINIENAELDYAVSAGDSSDMESESFDLINLNMMLIDNVRGNQ